MAAVISGVALTSRKAASGRPSWQGPEACAGPIVANSWVLTWSNASPTDAQAAHNDAAMETAATASRLGPAAVKRNTQQSRCRVCAFGAGPSLAFPPSATAVKRGRQHVRPFGVSAGSSAAPPSA